MTTTEAITRLREMQAQIIHGSNTFGDIADVLAGLVKERDATIAETSRLEIMAAEGKSKLDAALAANAAMMECVQEFHDDFVVHQRHFTLSSQQRLWFEKTKAALSTPGTGWVSPEKFKEEVEKAWKEGIQTRIDYDGGSLEQLYETSRSCRVAGERRGESMANPR